MHSGEQAVGPCGAEMVSLAGCLDIVAYFCAYLGCTRISAYPTRRGVRRRAVETSTTLACARELKANRA
jgi:hypothetical protein